MQAGDAVGQKLLVIDVWLDIWQQDCDRLRLASSLRAALDTDKRDPGPKARSRCSLMVLSCSRTPTDSTLDDQRAAVVEKLEEVVATDRERVWCRDRHAAWTEIQELQVVPAGTSCQICSRYTTMAPTLESGGLRAEGQDVGGWGDFHQQSPETTPLIVHLAPRQVWPVPNHLMDG